MFKNEHFSFTIIKRYVVSFQPKIQVYIGQHLVAFFSCFRELFLISRFVSSANAWLYKV